MVFHIETFIVITRNKNFMFMWVRIHPLYKINNLVFFSDIGKITTMDKHISVGNKPNITMITVCVRYYYEFHFLDFF